MTNPLLTKSVLPHFLTITPQDVMPAIKSVLDSYKQTIETILKENSNFSWNNLCQPLEEANNRLSRAWSPIDHLSAVKNSTELRQVYDTCLPILSAFSTWMGQHTGLYQAYKSLKNSAEFDYLNQAQRKSIENTLRDFELSGIGLPAEKKKRYGEIAIRIAELKTKFSNNVLDATMGWTKLIKDSDKLTGIPESALSAAKALAKSKGEEGWLFSLDIPSYLPIITYAHNRELRQEIYHAYNTRASDQGPNAGKWDNSDIMDEILALRYELAKLLGFNNFAEKSLATKMAESPEQVLDFLTDLAQRAYHQGEKEFTELTQFTKDHYGIDKLEPWDLVYYSEKQKKHKFSIENEQLRAYFPKPLVINGLFEIINKIYNLTAKERYDVEVWHPDVRFFELYDERGDLYGSFYLDLYAREHKRGGAWMNDCAGRLKHSDGSNQNPVAYIICNFNQPIGDKPALFTHDEVVTLFHEFGHGLHHMLTKIDVADVAGINGVPWDAVELPSQFMENWCWEPKALAFISGHYKTGERLPKLMLDNMLAAKNYQAAMFILRQLEFGLFDFRLHYEYLPEKSSQILSTLQLVKKQVAVVPSPKWSRFPHAFSHIFAGGYGAGYYSYLWADVLAADAFSRFTDEGIFNRSTGLSFLDNILSRGGSEEPMILFERFRGRKPKLDAMLQSYGINK
ncbi:Oligopeptidase A [Arsenophonus endosymbiont of Aleurodicus dispersus]|uniref:oligopeptidase A n=1 Tax=Arsenophonus endosymbiont of Aleurodicus dispersus TaxID=235559 RepID=UPI000EB5A172|nr:oligopeptidase A [Arsenophonus endosymbiont of Aleurodicus dispersus]VAY02505.1 Oligopeptidase A [Arsenophonus endosymbiont of Aleurodicus dispersus]